MINGEGGEWKRAHCTPRRACFTLHRVAGGPGRDAVMITKRTTKGTFVGSGKEFTIVDDYANPNCAHRILANTWIGTIIIHKEKEKEDPAEVQVVPKSAPCGRTWTAIVKSGMSEKGRLDIVRLSSH